MSFQIQQQIRNNAEDIQSYLKDLHKWNDEINNTKQVVNNQKQQLQQVPIRGNIGNNLEEIKKYKRDKNTVQDYYRAWDKFDVDEELKKVEKDEEKIEKDPTKIMFGEHYNSKQSKEQKSMQIIVKGGRSEDNQIDLEKDRGNLHFRNNEFDKAIQSYDKCIEILNQNISINNLDEIANIIYTNKAQVLFKLKKYEECLDNCNIALQYNPQNLKTIFRRAQTYKKLNNIKKSYKDLKMAINIITNQEQSDNVVKLKDEIIKEIQQVQLFINNNVLKSKQKMISIPQMFIQEKTVKVQVKDQNNKQQEINIQLDQNNKQQDQANKQQEQNIKENEYQENIKQLNMVGNEFTNLKNIDQQKQKKNQKENGFDEEQQGNKVHFGQVQTQQELKKYNPRKAMKIQNKKGILKKNSKYYESQNEIMKKIESIKDSKQLEMIIQQEYNIDVDIIKSQQELIKQLKNIHNQKEEQMKFLKRRLDLSKLKTVFSQGIEIQLLLQLIEIFNHSVQNEKEFILKFLQLIIDTQRFEITMRSLLKKEKIEFQQLFDQLKKDIDEKTLGFYKNYLRI